MLQHIRNATVTGNVPQLLAYWAHAQLAIGSNLVEWELLYCLQKLQIVVIIIVINISNTVSFLEVYFLKDST
jgi:hypothetical protein